MTYEVTCLKCGYTLYSGFDLRSPQDILKSLSFKCKKCGTKLTIEKFRVDVRKIGESFS